MARKAATPLNPTKNVSGKKLPFLGARMPKPIIDGLIAEAQRDGRPLSNLVRKILTDWLEGRPQSRVNGTNHDTHRTRPAHAQGGVRTVGDRGEDRAEHRVHPEDQTTG